MTLVFVISMIPVSGFASSTDMLTRAGWLSQLAATFEMSIESDEYPDNYFSDLDASSPYYHDIMVAAEFGLIDAEMGDAIYPDSPVTREFAAHTLNYCLGFQLDDGEAYDFADVEDVVYPDDAQVALNRGWFNLVSGKFMPEAQATASELTAMLEDGKARWEESQDTSGSTSGNYTFVEGVIVVPDTATIAKDDNGNINILGSSVEIPEGSVFVVYSEGIPFGYRADKVTQIGAMTVIVPSEVDASAVFKEVNAGGEVDVDLNDFQEAEGVTASVSPEIVELPSEGIKARSISYANKKLTVSKRFGSGSNWVEVNATYSNLKFNWRNSGYYSVKLSGSVTYTVTGRGSKDFTAEFGSVPLGLIGRFYISSDISFSGSVATTQAGKFETGLEYRSGSGFRYLKSFDKKGSPSMTAQCNMTAGMNVGLEFGVPMIKGSVGATVGVNVGATINKYASGSPKICAVISGHLYSRVRASATFGIKPFSVSKSKSWDIWTSRNSPIRFLNHFHDGVAIGHSCSKGNNVRYVTPAWSRYTGNGYYGYEGAGGSTYTDATGEPFTIFEYSLDDKQQATITKYYGNVSTLMIPQTIDGYQVVGIGSDAFQGNKTFESVVIPDSVTNIQESAFSGCLNLASVSLPSSLTEIEHSTFKNTGLVSLALPDTLTRINGGMSYFSAGAFSNCTSLIEVMIPDSVITIEERTFQNCTSLREIRLSKNLRLLDSYAFGGCTSLTVIEIPKALESGSSNTINSYDGPFSGCSSLETVSFEPGATRVAYKLFSGCSGLKAIAIPDTVVTIEAFAFQNCSNLQSVLIPNSVTSIDGSDYYGGAFSDCTSLREISIPDSVTQIGQRAFEDCSALSKVTLSKNLKSIDYFAFARCVSLTAIEIPKSLESANSYSNSYSGPFAGCSSLKTVTFENGMQKIPNRLFDDCDGIEQIVIPETVISIEHRAFYNCTSLVEISMPQSVQSIEDSAFAYCEKLETIRLPNSLRQIPNRLFYNCSSLTSINWPVSLEEIGSNAFDGCASLKVGELPKTLKEIGQYAFRNNDAIQTLTIPDYVNYVGSSAFFDCDSLTSINFGNGLTSIRDNTFRHCDKLDSVIFPYFMESIGSSAFAECTDLSSITVPRKTNSIASNAFSYPTKMTVYGVSGTYAESFAKDQGMTFVSQEVYAEKVSFESSDVRMNRGSTFSLNPSISPASFTDAMVWKSSNTDIATVDEKGIVKAIGSGKATVKLVVGNVSASCSVTVVQPVESIDLYPYNEDIQALEQLKISASVYPSNALDPTLTWSSSDPEVATVDENGIVTGVSKGSTRIIATANDGSGISEYSTVTVVNNAYIASSIDELESLHEYENSSSDFWVYTLEGASKISVTFDERTSVEDGFDYIRLYDKTLNIVGEYTGQELAGKTVSLTGDTVRIKLISDNAGSDWGFKVTEVKEAKTSAISKSLTTLQAGKLSTISGGSAAKVKGGTVTMVATQSGIPATKYPIAGNMTAFKVQNAKGFSTKAFNVTYTDGSGKQFKLTNNNGLTRVGAYSPTANTYEFTVPDAKDISVNVTFEFTAKTTEISKALIHPGGTTSASSCDAGTVEMVATQSGIAATKYPKVGGRTAFKVTTKKGYKVSAFNVTYTDAAGKQVKLINGNGLTRVGKYSASSNTYEFDVPASNDVKVNVTYTR